MGIAYNPAVVSNGLVLALDAGNVKSFDGRENLFTYSEQFDNAAWSKGNLSVVTNTTATLAPDGTQTWTGYINDLKIYNRALTSSEVQQNFNATRGRFGI